MSNPNESHDSPAGIVLPPDPMSKACGRFFDEYWELLSFLTYVMMLAVDKDDYERRFAQLKLEHVQLTEDAKKQAAEIAIHGVGAWDALMSRQQMLLQIILCRAVDSYLIYLSHLLALVFLTKPETLRSNDSITVQDVLQFKSMDDLIDYLADKKVHSLANKSMRDLVKFFDKRFGFKVIEETDYLDRIVLLIELRNLIVHNRAIINRVFKDRQPTFAGSIGDLIGLDTMETLYGVELLAGSVIDIEKRAAKQWGFCQPVPLEVHAGRMSGMVKVMDHFEKAIERKKKEIEERRAGRKSL
jgi:hypothetical protein